MKKKSGHVVTFKIGIRIEGTDENEARKKAEEKLKAIMRLGQREYNRKLEANKAYGPMKTTATVTVSGTRELEADK